MLTWQGFNPDWWFPTVSPVVYTEAVTGTLYAIFHHSFFWNILLRAHFAIARLPRSILRKNTGDWPGPVCWLNSLCDWAKPVVGAGWQEVPPNLVTGCRTSFKVLWVGRELGKILISMIWDVRDFRYNSWSSCLMENWTFGQETWQKMSQLNADSSDDEGGVSAFYIIIKSCDKTQCSSFL